MNFNTKTATITDGENVYTVSFEDFQKLMLTLLTPTAFTALNKAQIASGGRLVIDFNGDIEMDFSLVKETCGRWILDITDLVTQRGWPTPRIFAHYGITILATRAHTAISCVTRLFKVGITEMCMLAGEQKISVCNLHPITGGYLQSTKTFKDVAKAINEAMFSHDSTWRVLAGLEHLSEEQRALVDYEASEEAKALMNNSITEMYEQAKEDFNI